MRRLALPALLLGACVSYRARPVDPAEEAEKAARPPEGPLSYEAAVRFAVAQNPDLRAMRLRMEAIAERPPPEPLSIGAGANEDSDFVAEAEADALSLLGLGVRRADLALARARRREALLRHHERAREIAAGLAEVFETERLFSSLAEPPEPMAPDAFVRAGLLPVAAEKVARADRAGLDAERSARASLRAANRIRLLRLLGCAPGAAPDLSLPEPPLPPPGPCPPRRALEARADVQRSLAEYEVAEARLRRAVAAQFPSITLEPSLGGDPLSLFGMVSVRIPVGASREARAAEAEREAARADLAALVLDALAEAERTAGEAALAAARLLAARERAAAAEELRRTAPMRLQTDASAPAEVVLEGREAIEAAAALREAALEDLRARFAAARAAGWPG